MRHLIYYEKPRFPDEIETRNTGSEDLEDLQGSLIDCQKPSDSSIVNKQIYRHIARSITSLHACSFEPSGLRAQVGGPALPQAPQLFNGKHPRRTWWIGQSCFIRIGKRVRCEQDFEIHSMGAACRVVSRSWLKLSTLPLC